MPRSRADISNTALRIFLQEMGAAYDRERGLEPYDAKGFAVARAFFFERCCYCGDELIPNRVAQDHLEPLNKSALGLHAWGNVVPACQDCNHEKQGSDWRDFLIRRAAAEAATRHAVLTAFVAKYRYEPNLTKLRETAEALYEEVGVMASALIAAKVRRLQKGL